MSYYPRHSQDSAQRPLGQVDYSQAGQYEPKYGGVDYGAGGNGYNTQSNGNQQQMYGQGQTKGNSQNYTRAGQPQKKSKKWLWILLAILAVLIVAGAVVGGIVGSNAAKKNNAAVSSGANTNGSGTATPTKTSGSAAGAVVPTGVDANGNPLYPTASSAAGSTPTFRSNAALSCPPDNYTFSPNSLTVRTGHPLLFAPASKWSCLPKLIAADSYMSSWNTIILANATKYYGMAPTAYTPDGGLSGSGVLDVAREVQLRVKHWGYAWKITGDTKWVDRCWAELVVASGNSTTQSFGAAGNNWNTAHFLDLAEFTAAFGIAYDWFYEAWTPAQRSAIRSSIINLGLQYGINAYADPTGAGAAYTWWTKVNGNWNCVCNNGLTLGALAIANEDTTGIAARLLAYTVPNAAANCAMGPTPDGTWSETANYWYFGTTGHSQMAAALLTATGSTQNLLDSNPGMKFSSLYHMYVSGMQGLFAYGDTGPNKYTATANGLMFYGSQYNIPMYMLFQRDRADAPEPMSMLFYDPQVAGDFWEGLALDKYFPNNTDAWVSMRSSWTDSQGVYVAMKSGGLQGHQTHQDVDIGTFVLDAMGQRWAGELGSGNYLAEGYFSSELQNSQRWDYYRKRTEGQNTLLMGGQDQNVLAVPTTIYDSTADVQSALTFTTANSSTAYFTTDMTDAYNGTNTHRAIRLMNGRKQILLQDEMNVPAAGVQWRMHTNATIALSNNGKTATLTLGGKTLIAQLLSPSGASFGTAQPVRLASDIALPAGAASQDQPNPGTTVLTVTLGAGQQTIEVLFNPQWPGYGANSFITPANVPIASWSLTSHL